MQREEEAAAAVCRLTAAQAASQLHMQLSHGPHACTPFALDRSLRALPLPPAFTACTLATARWLSRSELPAALRLPVAGSARELGLLRGMHFEAAVSSEDASAGTAAVSQASLKEASSGGVVALSPRPVRRMGAGTQLWIQEARLVDRQACECLPECMVAMHDAPRSVRASAHGRAARVEGAERWASGWSDGGDGALRAVRAMRRWGSAAIPVRRTFGTGAAVGLRGGTVAVQASRVRHAAIAAQVARFVIRMV